jgi:hypothetical protein
LNKKNSTISQDFAAAYLYPVADAAVADAAVADATGYKYAGYK